MPANNRLASTESICFQPDGAPPHFATAALLDFFLWDNLKCVVYRNKPVNLEEFGHRITEKMDQISPQNSTKSVTKFQ